LAMKLDDETIGIVFDACEICGSQGYIQESGAVICLNCDADINPATFKKGGGCNPIPLSSKIEGDHIVIRVEDLKQEEKRF
ncbi:MAG TPA: Fe-S-containing protein, partial [Acidobacteriota bacterium]|nr:Fe-S-containing protein [Acidobacteriota bacterium]